MTDPVVKLKRSDVTGKIPAASDLEYGEVALNYADGKIYYKKVGGQIDSIGSGASAGTRRRYEIIASNNQSSFTFGTGYVPGFIDVIHNGSVLSETDYVATDGTNVVLTSPAATGDLIVLIAYDAVGLADTYRKNEVDALATEKAIIMAIALG